METQTFGSVVGAPCAHCQQRIFRYVIIDGDTMECHCVSCNAVDRVHVPKAPSNAPEASAAHRKARWLETYIGALNSVYFNNPEWLKGHSDMQGAYREQDVRTLAERMTAALAIGDFNKESPAVRTACQRLGIPNTYEAIGDFLKESIPTSER